MHPSFGLPRTRLDAPGEAGDHPCSPIKLRDNSSAGAIILVYARDTALSLLSSVTTSIILLLKYLSSGIDNMAQFSLI